MMLSFDSFWESLLSAGLPGAVVGVAVLALVYLLGFTDLFKAGAAKRYAVVIASFLFAGYEVGEVKSALVAALGMAISTLGKLLIDAVLAELEKRKKK